MEFVCCFVAKTSYKYLKMKDISELHYLTSFRYCQHRVLANPLLLSHHNELDVTLDSACFLSPRKAVLHAASR
jgi:hypothetical protein